jgi:hypothetical protein
VLSVDRGAQGRGPPVGPCEHASAEVDLARLATPPRPMHVRRAQRDVASHAPLTGQGAAAVAVILDDLLTEDHGATLGRLVARVQRATDRDVRARTLRRPGRRTRALRSSSAVAWFALGEHAGRTRARSDGRRGSRVAPSTAVAPSRAPDRVPPPRLGS